MELSNVSGVVNTTDTLVFVCGKQSSIFNIIFSNITGLASNVDIKIFNKKLNRELNLPKGEEFLIYLAKGLSVQPNNILKFGVSVGKRNFKRAVKRNILKRRMREAFRISKSDIIQHLLFANRKIELMIIFKAKEELSFQIIQLDLQKALAKLKNQIH